jgi:C-terminal processing protease CtpA/Prc
VNVDSVHSAGARIMPLRTWLSVIAIVPLLLAFAFSGMVFGSAGGDAEQLRIARLAGLGRLWGVVKFFHPTLAYRDIDWDAALVVAIPKVNAAKSAQEYSAALNDFLSVLKDPATFAVWQPRNASLAIEKTGAAASPPASQAYFRSVDGNLVVHAASMAQLLMGGNTAEYKRVDGELAGAIAKAKGAVFDLRFMRGEADPLLLMYLDIYLRSQLPDLLAAPVQLASSRFRQHFGYRPQPPSFSSGGYHSSLVTVTPEILSGHSKAPLPLAFITRKDSTDFAELLSGLESAKVSLVVEEAESGASFDNPGNYSVPMLLPEDVKVFVRVREIIAPDGRTGFEPDSRVPAGAGGEDPALDAALTNLTAARRRQTTGEREQGAAVRPDEDKVYAGMTFPDEAYRLLALFRLWAVVNYFYPYKDLMDQPWDTVLTEYIPIFESNKNALDYQLTVMKLATRVQDSHVRVIGAEEASRYLGDHMAPLALGFVQGSTVVAGLPDPAAAAKAGIVIGDVILSVDGESVEQRRLQFEAVTPASTPQSLHRDVEPALLRGARDKPAKLRIRDASGRIRDTEIERTLKWPQDFLSVGWLPIYRQTPKTYGLLPSGLGYIDLERLAPGEVDAAMDIAGAAPAIIFDLRGYPKGTGFEIAPRLLKARTDKPVAATLYSPQFLRGDLLAADAISLAPKLTSVQHLQTADKPPFRGKVAVLIDEWTQSQAEHTCLLFGAATDVTFIGTPTAGANGDISQLVLPGDLRIPFTGQEIRFADGKQLQRLGVQPTIRVEPTLSGLREGRDEVLEAAIGFFQQQSKP